MNDPKWQAHLKHIQSEYSDRHEGGQELSIHEGNLNYLHDCKKVLDIGCGVGHAIMKLKSRGVDAHGLTLNPREIEGRLDSNIALGDMHELPFEDETFDGAMMWDVLEHALAPIIVLWEANRVLQPNGKLLVYLPPQHWIEHPVHTWVPTQRQARHMFGLTGFKVEHMEDRQDESALWRLRKV